jgi:hypothetical protein
LADVEERIRSGHRLPHHATTAAPTHRVARTWTDAQDGSTHFASISWAVSAVADGARCAVECDGGAIVLVRCHIANVRVGVCPRDTVATLQRMHVDGADVPALQLEDGSTVHMTENSSKGRSMLRGTVGSFLGNDIDMLVVHGALRTSGNRVSTIIHAYDE